MSYILDALKKSESERRAGIVPGGVMGASYVLAPQANSRRGGVALLVGVGMLAAGLALGNWRPWQRTTPVGTVEVLQPTVSVLNPPPIVAAKADGVVAPKTVWVGQEKAPATGRPNLPPVAAKKSLDLPAKALPVATTTERPMLVAKSATVTTSTAPLASAPVIETAAANPVARIVSYRELPANVQGALPSIVFGGFAGGGEAEGRVAFINNRLVREGEEVSPGLKLETVDQDGVVLAYQGHRFRPSR